MLVQAVQHAWAARPLDNTPGSCQGRAAKASGAYNERFNHLSRAEEGFRGLAERRTAHLGGPPAFRRYFHADNQRAFPFVGSRFRPWVLLATRSLIFRLFAAAWLILVVAPASGAHAADRRGSQAVGHKLGACKVNDVFDQLVSPMLGAVKSCYPDLVGLKAR